MCLYLGWNPSATDIIVGLSNDSVAITSLGESQLEVEQEKAHNFKLWTTSFDIQQTHLAYTGSEDYKFNSWNLHGSPQVGISKFQHL
ncbi:LOW QUALITY PROTEIN: WD40/YVTN repeat-like-containing domain containing protein [Parasponia andersonii]|uniref:WD40/YVTN repeat-like-containing domain containing protein n=1 Tax=Parasponia andersonii TaxID=3476 RepID=A0A2P5DFZ9_PARAD|nr:LOW QUALITY PROTEIN: WD40/YVTN repeat-like-containing domain containing protein [Parasponia andersonii]